MTIIKYRPSFLIKFLNKIWEFNQIRLTSDNIRS
jgi:hypothetical protein